MNKLIQRAKVDYLTSVEKLKGKEPGFAAAFSSELPASDVSPEPSHVERPAISECSALSPRSQKGSLWPHKQPPQPGSVETSRPASVKPVLKGFGYLYKRGSFWWIRYSVRGKDFRESSKSERESDAMRLLKRRWKDVGKGRFIGPSEERVMMDSLFDALVVDYKNNQRRSLGTLMGRLRHLRVAFGNLRAIDVMEDRIESYKVKRLADRTENGNKPIQPATVNRELAALRKAFSLAVRHKRISAAPAITMLVENNVRQGFLELPDVEMLIGHLPLYLQDYTSFAFWTGWRLSAVKALLWTDVRYEPAGNGETIKAIGILLRPELAKNGKPTLIPVKGALKGIIERRWLVRAVPQSEGSVRFSPFIFHQESGNKIGDFRKSWAAACKKAEFGKVNFHDLRRSMAIHYERSGVSESVIMELGGWKTRSVFRRYRIVNEDDLGRALEQAQSVTSPNLKRRVVPIKMK